MLTSSPEGPCPDPEIFGKVGLELDRSDGQGGMGDLLF